MRFVGPGKKTDFGGLHILGYKFRLFFEGGFELGQIIISDHSVPGGLAPFLRDLSPDALSDSSKGP